MTAINLKFFIAFIMARVVQAHQDESFQRVMATLSMKLDALRWGMA